MAGLVKAVDEKISENPDLKAFVVVLTDDADKTSEALKKLAQERGIANVPMTLIESEGGPPAYRIAEDAGVTVLMWKGAAVKVNRAFARGKMTDDDAESVAAEIPKILE